jgi:hypothetical protein
MFVLSTQVRLLEAIRAKNSQLQQVSRPSKDTGGAHMPLVEAGTGTLLGDPTPIAKAEAETLFQDPTHEIEASGAFTSSLLHSTAKESSSTIREPSSTTKEPSSTIKEHSSTIKESIAAVDNQNIEAHSKGEKHVTKVTTKGKFSFDFPDFKILFQGNKDKGKAGLNESAVTDEHASGNHDAFASHFTSPSSPMPSTSKPSPSLSAFTNDAYGTASSSVGAISTEDIEAKSAAAFLLYQSSKAAKNDIFSPLTNKLSTIGVAAAAVALSAAGLELGEAGLTGGWLEEITAMATVATEGSGGGALGFILGPMAVFTAVPSAVAVKLWRSNTDKAYKKEKVDIMSAKILEKNRINEEKKKVEEEREKALQSSIKEKEIERLTKEVKDLEDKEILQKKNKLKAENEIIAQKKLREELQVSKDNEERNAKELLRAAEGSEIPQNIGGHE